MVLGVVVTFGYRHQERHFEAFLKCTVSLCSGCGRREGNSIFMNSCLLSLNSYDVNSRMMMVM